MIAADGVADADNATFSINGDRLVLAESPDFETQESYAIHVQVSDGALNYAESFVIGVNDLVEIAEFTVVALADAEVPENTAYFTKAPATTGDLPAGDLSWRLGGDDDALFGIDSGTGVVTLVEQDYEVPQDQGKDRTYRFTLTATDEDNNTATSAVTTITITDVTDTAELTLVPASQTVAEDAVTATVTLVLDNAVEDGFTVTASTADDLGAGAAVAGEDYTAVMGPVPDLCRHHRRDPDLYGGHHRRRCG